MSEAAVHRRPHVGGSPPADTGPQDWRRRFAGLVFLGAALAAWQLLSSLGIWEPWLFPPPSAVAERIGQGIASGRIPIATGVTLARLVGGYALSALIGILLGLAIARFRLLESSLGVVVLGLQALPSITWFPIALLWFGLSEVAVLFIVVMGALFSVAIATESGIRNVPPIYVRAARTMGAQGFALYRKVVLPAALPSILTGMKLGWTFAWRSLMAAEMLYMSGGLGEELMTGRELNAIDRMFAVMIAIVFVGLLSDRLIFGVAERRIRERWGFVRA